MKRLDRVAAVVLTMALCSLGASTLGQSVRQITHNPTDVHVDAAIDDSGDRIVMISSADLVGTNPSHALQVFAWDLSSGTTHQVTSVPEGVGGRGEVASSVGITDDGQTIAFISPADPVGLNPDGSLEIFTVSFDGTGISQVTSVPSPTAGTIWSLRLAGSGSHIVFLARMDPLGSNGSLGPQLFRIEADGSNLEQLTTVPMPAPTPFSPSFGFDGFSISDDGSVVAFSFNADLSGDSSQAAHKIWVLPAAGPLEELAGSAGRNPFVSGNGEWIVYEAGPYVSAVRWQAPAMTRVVADREGRSPTVSDDGGWIYFEGIHQPGAVYRAENAEAPTSTVLQPGMRPVVSGNNTRIISPRPGAVPAEGLTDGGRRWYAYDVDGADEVALTDTELDWRALHPSVSADGERLALLGGRNDTHVPIVGAVNPSEYDAYSMRSDGSELTRLTLSGEVAKAVIRPDGAAVVYHAALPGQWGNLFQVGVDGTGSSQLTIDGDTNFVQTVGRDNDLVVFLSSGVEIVGCCAGLGQFFTTSIGGGGFQQITTGDQAAYGGRLDQANEWVVYWSYTNHDGLNPHPTPAQILRARTDGTAQERITLGPQGAWLPDVSADGDRIVYASERDPFGTNPEGNFELFLYQFSTGTETQLTFTAQGEQSSPEITPDGQRVYFLSSSWIFEPRTTDLYELYRLHVGSGTLERVGGFYDPRGGLDSFWFGVGYTFSVADDGDVFLSGPLDLTGENPDFSWEVWHVDYDAAPIFMIGADSPTVVRFGADPRYVRYDLIRGDLDQLGAGPGGTTELGDVVCLGDELTRPQAGVSDTAQRAAGHGFFYLYRGSQGLWDGPGSYGDGAPGMRVASSGDCP